MYKIGVWVGVGKSTYNFFRKRAATRQSNHSNSTKVIITVDGKAHDVYKTCSYFMYRPLCFYTYHRGERS